MRRRKWLLIVVSILILINLFYFLLPQFLDINAYFGKILKEKIGEKIDAKITFNKVILTTKFVRISDIQINHKKDKFNFSADQLYLEYNFLRLLIHRFRFQKSIKKVKFFSPKISYEIQILAENANSDFSELENILKQLSQISIINGKINIFSQNKRMDFDEEFLAVNLRAQKKLGKWKIDFSAEHLENSKINISGFYKKSKSDLNINLENFRISDLKIGNKIIKNGLVNLNIPLQNGKITNGLLTLDSVQIEIDKKSFFIQNAECEFDENCLNFEKNMIVNWKDCVAKISGKVTNYFTKNPKLDLKIISKKIPLHNFSKEIIGIMNFNGNVKNSFDNPEISGNLFGKKIEISSEIIDSFYTKLEYKKNNISFHSGRFLFEHQPIIFSGNLNINSNILSNSKINFKFTADKFQFPMKNIKPIGNIEITTKGNLKNPIIEGNISDANLVSKIFNFNNFDGKISYFNDKILFDFYNKDNSITFSGTGKSIFNLPKINLKFESKNLLANKIFKKNSKWIDYFRPQISSEFDVKIDSGKVFCNGFLGFQKSKKNQINGKISIRGNFPLFKSPKKNQINIFSDSLKIKNRNYKFDFLASTKMDTIFVEKFIIDEKNILDRKFLVSKLDEKLNFNGEICLSDYPIDKILNLIFLEQNTKNIQGNIDGRIKFLNDKNKFLSGNFQFKNIVSKNLKPVNADVSFYLTDSTFNLSEIKIFKNLQNSSKKEILKGSGKINLRKNNSFEFMANGKNIDFKNDIYKGNFAGKFNYEICGYGSPKNPQIDCMISSKNGKLYKTNFDSLHLEFSQTDEIFHLKKFDIFKQNEYKLSSSGDYGYNFFQKKFSEKPTKITFTANGDFLSVIGNYILEIKKSSSEGNLKLVLVTENKKPVWKFGNLEIKNGELEIKNQPEKFQDINILAKISDNQIRIGNCSTKIGKGRIFITNIFENESENIKIGELDIGTIQATTDEKGVSFHIPNYMPERALGNFIFTGFEDDYFRIFNDAGNWKLAGKILASNGKILFPPKKSKKKTIFNIFPQFLYNIDLVFHKNVWYVTNPFHIRIKNYDSITFRSDYKSDKLNIFLNLNSEKGDIRLSGNIFRVEYINLEKSVADKFPKVDAKFYKKTADGSKIYLEITSVAEDEIMSENIQQTKYGNFRISLHSNNPNDATLLSIMSKLQYGKNIEELSEEERKNLYRDEAIKIAGDQLENVLFESVITPIESTIQQIFGLDFFRLKTGVMENILEHGISIFSQDENLEVESETQPYKISELSKEIILENLSVAMGKYVTENWYINYEAAIQKELTIEQETQIGIEHEISFQYDLPFNFQITYSYKFSPMQEEEIQKISLEATVNF